MLTGMEWFACQNLAVAAETMRLVVRVESSGNPYAIGVVGGRLARQPRDLDEAIATVRALEAAHRNYALGLAQVSRANLAAYGLATWEQAFSPCPNLAAGARILAACHARAQGDWDRAFSCYYAGDFSTGFRDGYVAKVHAAMQGGATSVPAAPGAGHVPGTPRRARPGEPARLSSSARSARGERTQDPAAAARLAARRVGSGVDTPAEPGIGDAGSSHDASSGYGPDPSHGPGSTHGPASSRGLPSSSDPAVATAPGIASGLPLSPASPGTIDARAVAMAPPAPAGSAPRAGAPPGPAPSAGAPSAVVRPTSQGPAAAVMPPGVGTPPRDAAFVFR